VSTPVASALTASTSAAVGKFIVRYGRCRVRSFALDALDTAMTAAAEMRGLDFVARVMS
jgi:hypothetical protein